MPKDPYGSLEPRANGPAGQMRPPETSGAVALVRGLRKRCPRCGERRIFEGWFTLRSLCPRCSLRFEEEQGGFLGAMTINYVIAFGVWIVGLTGVLIVTAPEVPVPGLLVMSVVVLGVVPVWFYPRSKTIWAAIEWLAHRTDPDYRAPGPASGLE
ncbi:MAG: DUF983 domain-containing protein [Actinomycetota bacterium]